MSISANLTLLDAYDTTILEMELYLETCIKTDDIAAYYALRTIPGVGKIALTFFCEIHDIGQFSRVGNFLSYARLVPGVEESDGKKELGGGGRKMGNAHLKWAFGEAATLQEKGMEGIRTFRSLSCCRVPPRPRKDSWGRQTSRPPSTTGTQTLF